jgi:hypothetical protein
MTVSLQDSLFPKIDSITATHLIESKECFVDTLHGTLTILDSVVSNLSNLRDFLVGLKSTHLGNPCGSPSSDS